MCAFFNTRDEEYRALLPFVHEGFQRGEKAIHIVDPALRTDHLARLRAAGIPVDRALDDGQLEVDGWTDTYLPRGTFDERATVARVKGLLGRARAEGFPHARIIGHGEWVLASPGAQGMLVGYEARIDDVLAHFDASVVCSYDRSQLASATMVDLVRAHSTAVVDGALVPNPLFTSPSRLMARLRAPVVSVIRDRFVAALVAGARREAFDVVLEDALAVDVPAATIYLGVIQPALYDIGRLWQQGRITVAHEHAATEIVRVALGQLRVHLPAAASNGRYVLVACVEGELHDLGARMAADFIETAGFEVQFLGANLPTATLTELVRSRPPQLLVLSATWTATAPALRRTIAAVRSVDDQLPVAVGGQIFARRPGLAKQLGVRFSGPDAPTAVTIAHRALGG